MEIGEKIKKIREAEGMTQKAFAEATGLSIRTLQGIEGKDVCSRVNLGYITRALFKYSAYLNDMETSGIEGQTTPEAEKARKHLGTARTGTESRDK